MSRSEQDCGWGRQDQSAGPSSLITALVWFRLHAWPTVCAYLCPSNVQTGMLGLLSPPTSARACLGSEVMLAEVDLSSPSAVLVRFGPLQEFARQESLVRNYQCNLLSYKGPHRKSPASLTQCKLPLSSTLNAPLLA